ncbi:helix-turn-helix domain-containing protein [Nocardia sp. NPDC050412]|uniref:helix-turn-helix domain-containing protein n=1 Tax=Nocardia sp. NPDC050412 TaxID=3364320 RepID=UPI0037A3F880
MAPTKEPAGKPAGTPKNPLGATGATVAKNVERLRRKHGLQYVELAARLQEIGRPIPTLGLRHIEAEKRRVDADDLIALAIALDANPNSLLLPPTNSAQHIVALTGAPNEIAPAVWEWANGKRPLPSRPPAIPSTVPKENRGTYARAYFENNTNPAVQNWTDQPNIAVDIRADDDGDD